MACPFHHVRLERKAGRVERGFSPVTESAGTMNLDFSASRTVSASDWCDTALGPGCLDRPLRDRFLAASFVLSGTRGHRAYHPCPLRTYRSVEAPTPPKCAFWPCPHLSPHPFDVPTTVPVRHEIIFCEGLASSPSINGLTSQQDYPSLASRQCYLTPVNLPKEMNRSFSFLL